MKCFNILICIFAVLFVKNGVSGRVIFNDGEASAEGGAEVTKDLPLVLPVETESQDGSSNLVLPAAEAESDLIKSNPASPIFPQDGEETGSEDVEGPKNEVPVIPAGAPGSEGAPDGRTFHHLAALHHKVESKVNLFLAKLLSPFIPTPEFWEEGPSHPHHFPQGPHHYYGNNYRKGQDQDESSSSPLQKLASSSPLNYFVNHPFNFKERLAALHHRLGKRSIVDTEEPRFSETEQDRSFPIQSQNQRQGKTLYKIIPNFEQNFNSIMKRVLGPIYGSKPTGGFFQDPTIDSLFKSSVQQQQQQQSGTPVLKYTTVMKLLPQIFQRMAHMLRVPQLFSGTPVEQHS